MHYHAAKLYLMRKKTENKEAKMPKSPQVHDQPAGNPAPVSTAATSKVWRSTALITQRKRTLSRRAAGRQEGLEGNQITCSSSSGEPVY